MTLTRGLAYNDLAGQPFIDVRTFGAVGDNATDNYEAFLAVSAAVNAAGGGVVVFPKGKYKVLRHITASNGIVNPLSFIGCSGVAIIGHGAEIIIESVYTRDAVTTISLRGLSFTDCDGVFIDGVKLKGNVENVTSLASFAEASDHGLYFASTNDVAMFNVDSSYFCADGLYVRDSGTETNPKVASKRYYAANCKFLYNARQGFSAIQLRTAEFHNCEFGFTGRITAFSPSAGIDIEPNRNIYTAAPDQMDVNTGDIWFHNCKSYENVGATFTAILKDSCDNIHIRGGSWTVDDGGYGGADGMIFAVSDSSMEGAYVNMGLNNICFLSYAGADDVRNLRIKGNTFYSESTTATMISCLTSDIEVIFSENRIVHKPASGFTSSYPVRFLSANAKIIDNHFYSHKEAYVDGGSGDRDLAISMFVKLSRGNIFETDLEAAAGDSGTAHFYCDYGADTVVENDVFIGTAQGIADTYRPALNSTFNTAIPYSKNGRLFIVASSSYDPPSLADGEGVTTSFSVPGAAIGDIVQIGFQRDLVGVIVSGWVSAADTVSVRFQNETGGAVNLSASAIKALVTKVPV